MKSLAKVVLGVVVASLMGLAVYWHWWNSPEQRRERYLSYPENVRSKFELDIDDYYWYHGRLPHTVAELERWVSGQGLDHWRGEVSTFWVEKPTAEDIRKGPPADETLLFERQRAPGGRWETRYFIAPLFVKGVDWVSHDRHLNGRDERSKDESYESVVSEVAEVIQFRWPDPGGADPTKLVRSVLNSDERIGRVQMWRIRAQIVTKPGPAVLVITSDRDPREVRFPLSGDAKPTVIVRAANKKGGSVTPPQGRNQK